MIWGLSGGPNSSSEFSFCHFHRPTKITGNMRKFLTQGGREFENAHRVGRGGLDNRLDKNFFTAARKELLSPV